MKAEPYCGSWSNMFPCQARDPVSSKLAGAATLTTDCGLAFGSGRGSGRKRSYGASLSGLGGTMISGTTPCASSSSGHRRSGSSTKDGGCALQEKCSVWGAEAGTGRIQGRGLKSGRSVASERDRLREGPGDTRDGGEARIRSRSVRAKRSEAEEGGGAKQETAGRERPAEPTGGETTEQGAFKEGAGGSDGQFTDIPRSSSSSGGFAPGLWALVALRPRVGKETGARAPLHFWSEWPW